MEFSGEFELEGVPPEDAWVVLSDPVAVSEALSGCRYIARVEGDDFNFDEYEPDEDAETLPEADPETVAARAFEEGGEYAALMQVGVGSVKPRFEARATITEREFPTMVGTVGGSASSSSFEAESEMTIHETEDGTRVEWWATADVTGRIAQMGSRVLEPVANKVVNSFFSNIGEQMTDVESESSGVTDRLRSLL